MRVQFITRAMAVLVLLGASASMGTGAFAQESASYRLSEQVFNAGGHPAPGGMLTSGSFRVRLDAIGGSVADPGLSGTNFLLAGSFVGSYPPPGAVSGLGFDASDRLVWNAERSAGVYNVYRGTLSAIPLSSDNSTCYLPRQTTTFALEFQTPAPGTAFYYMISAENLLGEEGPSRVDASGVPHAPSHPCPDP